MPDTPEAAAPGDAAETLLAFDFGLRRIGVAVGQSVTGSASPLGVVANGPNGPDYGRIDALIAEWHPDRLIVGVPLNEDGSPGELAPAIDGFIEALGRYALPIDTVDERHTSQEANAALKRARQAGSRGRIRKEHVDAAAAVLIAERYLRM